MVEHISATLRTIAGTIFMRHKNIKVYEMLGKEKVLAVFGCSMKMRGLSHGSAKEVTRAKIPDEQPEGMYTPK